MKIGRIIVASFSFAMAPLVGGFVLPKSEMPTNNWLGSDSLLPKTSIAHEAFSTLRATSSASNDVPETGKSVVKKGKSMEELRREGGVLCLNTPIGALNPFALYYGLVSLFLGIPWFVALKICQFGYWVTRGRFDKKVRIAARAPVFVHVCLCIAYKITAADTCVFKSCMGCCVDEIDAILSRD